MLCPKCNSVVQEESKFCPNCGADLPSAVTTVHEDDPVVIVEERPFVVEYKEEKKSPLGIVSIILGIAGAVLPVVAFLVSLLSGIPYIGVVLSILSFGCLALGILCSIVALVVGIIAKKKGCSKAGLIFGVIGLIIGIVYLAIQIVLLILSAVGVVGVGILAFLAVLFSAA